MAKDMKSYKYISMWSENTSDKENGINDVEDYITGYVRTDSASISFNGAWAQNIGENEMFIDIERKFPLSLFLLVEVETPRSRNP